MSARGRDELGSLPPSAPRPAAPSDPKGLRPAAPRGTARDSNPRSSRPDSAQVSAQRGLGSLRLYRISDAYLALAAFAFVELGGIGLLELKQFTGAFEVSLAVHALYPIALTLALPCAFVAGLVLELGSRGEGRAARASLAALAGLFAASVAYGVGGGRHLAGLRIPFAAAAFGVGALLAFAAAPLMARGMRRAGRLGIAFGCACFAVAFGLELVGVRVFPRLYPAFHLGLAAIALLVAASGSLGFRALDAAVPSLFGVRLLTPALARAALALAMFALGAAFTPQEARKLSRFDNVRLVYTDRAPALSLAVAFAARLAPPPAVDAEAPLAVPTSGHAIDFAGHDIVLISIDALRADHVGAYGYARATTPNLDRLAQGGAVFDAAYSPTPHTSYAVTSLMTGKYMRPLVLQGLGGDSETWAAHLRRYGYKTAAFYPPAVFFIDEDRFARFRDSGLDFEYQRVEFMPAKERGAEVATYLGTISKSDRVFLWVHLFEPHEPYEAHVEHPFGDRDIDRYDAEIAAADDGIQAVVDAVRAERPGAVVIITADHGEEFGEHGGRYHGTTVYEEQVRVPLVVNAPGIVAPRRVAAPVGLVDLLPTVLAALEIPRPARVRGADLGPFLAGLAKDDDPGFAFSETDAQTLLAKGSLRLVCARALGACALYDVSNDPGERVDVAAAHPSELQRLRAELRAVEASHGRYEREGLHAEGKGWPEALRRGLSGDGDAAEDVAALLDDADVAIRRKSAEVLFDLARRETAPALRLALVRDEDEDVKRWSALALTRLGQGAPKTRDLLQDADVNFRRLAALALAETGDDRGQETLVAWWRHAFPTEHDEPRIIIPFDREKQIVAALGRIKAKSALPSLLVSLGDVRLRPFVARALARIGEEAARPSLAERLAEERYQTSRVDIARALVELGGGPELRAPLIHWLGVPDPMPGGIEVAGNAKILDLVGGPRERDRARLRRFARSGVAVGILVPAGGNGKGLRVICRAKTNDGAVGEVRVGLRGGLAQTKSDHDSLVPKDAPPLDPATAVAVSIPAGDAIDEAFAALPPSVNAKVKPGNFVDFVFYATQNVELSTCVVVPLADELPPPKPEPWSPSGLHAPSPHE